MGECGIGGSIDRRASGWWRFPGRLAVVGFLFATGVLAVLVPVVRSTEMEDPKVKVEGVAYSGQVIERETGKPVEGAEIILERSIRGADPRTLPAWVGDSTIRTDADGRFRVVFPPEQVAERRLLISMRIRHPGFIPRKSRKVALADILHGQAHGDEPFFATIALERGVEYTAQVVVPGGRPAPGLPYAFENGAVPVVRPSPILTDDEEGDTDDDGRIRLRMPRTHALALFVGPPRTARARFPYAPYQHFWGTDNASGQPDVWAPTDLGRIVLARGIRLPGRLVDTEGRPIAGQTITAYPVLGRDRHTTTTEADGSFTLGPLRPANYQIYGEGQGSFLVGVDLDAPPRHRPIRVFQPVHVYLKEDSPPEPLILRELPTVRVEVSFVDAKGQPAPGSATNLTGSFFLEDRARPVRALRLNPRTGPNSSTNAREPEGNPGVLPWSLQDQPEGGHIVFLGPTSLMSATVHASPVDETTSYKYRPAPNGPILPGPPGRLGALEADRLMTIVAYRAPTVLVSVKTEDGVVLPDIYVNARHRIGAQNYGSLFVRQPDGRYRSQNLMPEHEYEITARDRGGVYDLAPLQRVNLPESGSAELSFFLRKRRTPPGVGQPAPPFTVKTIDGRVLSLATIRGKTVLIHFWTLDALVPEVRSLKAVHDRFENDGRFSMIGLCLSNDSDRANTVIRTMGLSWSQAMLRDGWYDPIAVAYGAQRDRCYLISPDGTLLARDLGGDALQKAVADALSGK